MNCLLAPFQPAASRIFNVSKQENKPPVLDLFTTMATLGKTRKSTKKATGNKAPSTPQRHKATQTNDVANPGDQSGGKMAFLYENITQRILAALEQGVLPWEKAHTITSFELPQNYVSKRPYTSINQLTMSLGAFERPYYLTRNQINELGGKITKGQKGTVVTFWKFPSEEKKIELLSAGKTTAPLFSYYYVWNVAQIEGIDFKLPCLKTLKAEAEARQRPALNTAIDRMQADGVTINHNCLDRPCYEVIGDVVIIPRITEFKTPEHFYKTMFHEFTHASGHPRRLNRAYIAAPLLGGEKTLEGRAFEELIAELGTSFVLGGLGVDLSQHPSLLDQASSYIGSWVGLLRNDRTLIVRAASKAQAAADYILNKHGGDDMTPVPDEAA